MGFTIAGSCLGDGRLPTRWLVERVHAEKPMASIILEQWTPFAGSLHATLTLEAEWARTGVSILKEIRRSIIS